MKPWKRTIKINILKIDLPYEYDSIMEYIYCNERIAFKECFEFEVSEHYHVFFGELKIIFLNRSRIFSMNKVIGGVSISLRSLQDLLKDNSLTIDMEIVKPDNLFSLDYYKKTSEKIGVVKLNISCKNEQKTTGYSIKTNLKWLNIGFIKFGWILEKFLTDYIARIIKLSFYIQQGTTKCRLRAIAGLAVIYLLQRVIYKRCDGNHDHLCYNDDCFKSYKEMISKKRAKKLLRALNYSTAAYSTSAIHIFGGSSPSRKMKDIADPVKRYILERCFINESDIIKIKNGSVSSMGFVMFFESKDLFVISFRGSCSKEDIFKILDADYVDFLNGFVHEGFLNLSMNFINTEMKEILKIMKNKNCKNILFTGHSMGAAVAICTYLILANIEKLENKFDFYKKAMRKLKMNVIGFSCPPVASKNIAETYYKDIEIYNYGNDVVTQLSFGSIVDLKYFSMSVAFQKEIVTDYSGFLKKTDEIRTFLKKSNRHEKLYCPGMLYHIRAIRNKSSQTYGIKQVNPDFFGEIRIDINNIFDHMMSKQEAVFKSIIENGS